MRFLERKKKIEFLLSLIKNEYTGNANKLADKLCVSCATVENYLALLREEGHQIGYCTRRKTYYLIEEKM
jgi:biotin operon repressor